MRRCLGIAGLIVAAVVFAGCGEADDELVFALKPDKDMDRLMAEKSRLEEFLTERIDRPVRAIIPLSGAVILEGLANGTIDAAYISATEMIHARDDNRASLLLAGEIDGNPYYQSYWVSLKEKPFEKVADLRDKRIAFSSRASTSGFVVPYWDLHQKGLLQEGDRPEAFFGEGNVWYGVGYVSAVEQVLAGDAEAAAISYYVLDEDRHLTAEQRERLKKVAEQGPVPTHVVAVRRTVPEQQIEALKNALLELNESQHNELRDRLFTSRLIEVDAKEHLAGLSEAMDLVRRLVP